MGKRTAFFALWNCGGGLVVFYGILITRVCTVNKGIFWLASYPKSGNTWFRIFLKNLLEDGDSPVSINNLITGNSQWASYMPWLDEVLSFDSADLYQSEVDRLRPIIYEWAASQTSDYRYHKIHDACWQLESGEWLVSEKATAGALYFIRNPLDIAISYANHCQSSIDKAIQYMGESKHCLDKNDHRSMASQAEQCLLSWSEHVLSWVDNPVINTYVVRYEDMKHQPDEVFMGAASYLKLPIERKRITKALRFSSLEVVQAQEIKQKFNEAPSKTKRFFRKGVAGDWQETLTQQQITRIISNHYEVMQRFGYLDEAGNPQVM